MKGIGIPRGPYTVKRLLKNTTLNALNHQYLKVIKGIINGISQKKIELT
jgi:hypothetical protein